jgi:hypothetical protein
MPLHVPVSSCLNVRGSVLRRRLFSIKAPFQVLLHRGISQRPQRSALQRHSEFNQQVTIARNLDTLSLYMRKPCPFNLSQVSDASHRI